MLKEMVLQCNSQDALCSSLLILQSLCRCLSNQTWRPFFLLTAFKGRLKATVANLLRMEGSTINILIMSRSWQDCQKLSCQEQLKETLCRLTAEVQLQPAFEQAWGSLWKLYQTRSLGALRAPTSSWRPFGPLDFALRALRPSDPRKKFRLCKSI